MSSVGRKIFIGILIFVGLMLAVWIGSAAYSGWQGYKWQKQTDAFQESLRRPYREDTYGGKTPEETWAMFLAALREGNVDLASKYFVVEKQEEWRGRLEVIIRDNLETALNNYSTFSVEKGIEDDKAYYYIKMPFDKSESGYIFSPVIFRFNLYSKIWKIAVL